MRRRSFLCLSVILVLGPMPSAQAKGPTVSGAGSTWSQIAVDQWRSDVAKFGLSINYQGVGSSAGRQFYMIDQVDFAVSEIGFLPDELEKLKSKGKSFQYSPIVAGGTSMMYNLRDATGKVVTSLKLSPRAVASIFTGQVQNWSDPLIKADNPGLRLPDQAIIPVIRSDGSGTSAQFSAFIDSVEPDIWDQFARDHEIPPEPTSYWPTFDGSVAQRGSDGVANYVANDSTGVGSIGYVEAGYAFQRGRPVASMKNVSGAYTQPTARNVAIALTQATINPDGTQQLERVYRHTDPNTYPISSYSYLITQTEGFDPAKGKVMGEFMLYMACEGQRSAEVLGYSPIPPNLVKIVFAAVSRIPGAPRPPPLSECTNPTIAAGSAVEGTSSSSVDGAAATTGDSAVVEGGGSSGGSRSAGSGRFGKTTGGAGASSTGAGLKIPQGGAIVQGDTAGLVRPSLRDLTLALAAAERHPGVPPLPFIVAAATFVGMVFFPTCAHLLWSRRR